MSDITLLPLTGSDGSEVIDIFNYYVRTSFGAFPEKPVPDEFFDRMMQAARGYPAVAARDRDGVLAGFGMLRPHNPLPAFAHTAEVTYFVRSDMTSRGIGTAMLRHLEAHGKKQGISLILAHISSRNEGSLRFHERHGFSEVGRFHGAGKKQGLFFDSVWMEKSL